MRRSIAVTVLAFVVGLAVGVVVPRQPAPGPSGIGSPIPSVSLASPSPAAIPTQATPTPGPSFVNPTPSPSQSLPFPAIPLVLGSDPAAGTIAFSERSGNWVFDGRSGTLGVLGLGSAKITNRHTLGVAPPFGDRAAAYDTRRRGFPRLLPQDEATYGSIDLSADGMRVVYLTQQRKLRIAFQQPFANVDGRALARDRTFSGPLRISPSGTMVALTGDTLHDRDPSRPFSRPDYAPLDLWLVDVATGNARQVMCTFAPCAAGLTPSGKAIAVLSWSPDEKYLLVRTPSLASGVDNEGTDNYIFNLASGDLTPLGPAVDLISWRSWQAPHTLYFASGKVSGQPGTAPTRLKRWSPDPGIEDLAWNETGAVSPSFDGTNSRLFYVATTATDRYIAVFDVASRTTRSIKADPAFAIDGVRVSEDGTTLLQLRHHLATGSIEIWISNAQGELAHPLVRFGTPLPAKDDAFVYRLRDVNLDSVAWDR